MRSPGALINWSVLPVVVLPSAGHGVLGTAFLVQSTPGYAVTAAHVMASAPGFQLRGQHVMVADPSNETRTALLLHRDDQWKPVIVAAWERHPTQDVALLRLVKDRVLPTPSFEVTAARVAISTTYSLLGYPDDDYWSLEQPQKVDLELTYSEGHVRKHRQHRPLPGLYGTDFLELSAPAGAGCSGAPVFARDAGGEVPIRVSAIYLGERRPDGAGNAVGYAVPFSAVAGWRSEMTGVVLE